MQVRTKGLINVIIFTYTSVKILDKFLHGLVSNYYCGFIQSLPVKSIVHKLLSHEAKYCYEVAHLQKASEVTLGKKSNWAFLQPLAKLHRSISEQVKILAYHDSKCFKKRKYNVYGLFSIYCLGNSEIGVFIDDVKVYN